MPLILGQPLVPVAAAAAPGDLALVRGLAGMDAGDRRGGVGDLCLAHRMVQRPAAEIAGADQPGIGDQYRAAILEYLDRGVPERLKRAGQGTISWDVQTPAADEPWRSCGI